MSQLSRRTFAFGVGAVLSWSASAEAKKKKRKKRSKRPRSVQIGGPGPGVSRNFNLLRGRYLATAEVTAVSSSGGLFFVDLYGPRGFMDFLFTENPEAPGNYRFQAITQVPTDGAYFLDVTEADGPWTIVMSPR
jgi:hypothetical protein